MPSDVEAEEATDMPKIIVNFLNGTGNERLSMIVEKKMLLKEFKKKAEKAYEAMFHTQVTIKAFLEPDHLPEEVAMHLDEVASKLLHGMKSVTAKLAPQHKATKRQGPAPVEEEDDSLDEIEDVEAEEATDNEASNATDAKDEDDDDSKLEPLETHKDKDKVDQKHDEDDDESEKEDQGYMTTGRSRAKGKGKAKAKAQCQGVKKKRKYTVSDAVLRQRSCAGSTKSENKSSASAASAEKARAALEKKKKERPSAQKQVPQEFSAFTPQQSQASSSQNEIATPSDEISVSPLSIEMSPISVSEVESPNAERRERLLPPWSPSNMDTSAFDISYLLDCSSLDFDAGKSSAGTPEFGPSPPSRNASSSSLQATSELETLATLTCSISDDTAQRRNKLLHSVMRTLEEEMKTTSQLQTLSALIMQVSADTTQRRNELIQTAAWSLEEEMKVRKMEDSFGEIVIDNQKLLQEIATASWSLTARLEVIQQDSRELQQNLSAKAESEAAASRNQRQRASSLTLLNSDTLNNALCFLDPSSLCQAEATCLTLRQALYFSDAWRACGAIVFQELEVNGEEFLEVFMDMSYMDWKLRFAQFFRTHTIMAKIAYLQCQLDFPAAFE